MIYGTLATAIVFVHFAFILFVMFGALLALRWKWAPWVHLPAAAWGVYVEVAGRVCPLTPLENRFREMAGGQPYVGAFLDHYLVELIYPRGLTAEMQVALGLGALALNVVLYTWVFRKTRKERRAAA